jgi:NAD dependent epimerase/dehydratase family
MARSLFELKGKTVFVAGHRGMVGSALVRRLAQENAELLTVGRREVDLRDQAAVFNWFAAKRPQVVFLAAAKVGGIVANNTLRAELIYDNLIIATNVIHAAHTNGAEKLMFLGSSCIPVGNGQNNHARKCRCRTCMCLPSYRSDRSIKRGFGQAMRRAANSFSHIVAFTSPSTGAKVPPGARCTRFPVTALR